MTGFILATKVKQTSGFDEQKKRRVYTVLKLRPCYVTQIKTNKKDGYQALQIGFANKKAQNITKVIKGQSEKAGIKSPLSFFSEIRLENWPLVKEIDKNGQTGYQINDQELYPGMLLDPAVLFKLQDKVSVTGISKSKGFAGVVKRHGFAGGPKTHGQSDRLRAPGSIGSGTTPGRIWKGKKMAGRMGGVVKTVKGLKISQIDKEAMTVQGLVPGHVGSVIKVVGTKL